MLSPPLSVNDATVSSHIVWSAIGRLHIDWRPSASQGSCSAAVRPNDQATARFIRTVRTAIEANDCGCRGINLRKVVLSSTPNEDQAIFDKRILNFIHLFDQDQGPDLDPTSIYVGAACDPTFGVLHTPKHQPPVLRELARVRRQPFNERPAAFPQFNPSAGWPFSPFICGFFASRRSSTDPTRFPIRSNEQVQLLLDAINAFNSAQSSNALILSHQRGTAAPIEQNSPHWRPSVKLELSAFALSQTRVFETHMQGLGFVDTEAGIPSTLINRLDRTYALDCLPCNLRFVLSFLY